MHKQKKINKREELKSKVKTLLTKLIIIFAVFILYLFPYLLTLSPVNAAPPANFQTTLVVGNGLDGPSGFDIAPDGRIFILERTGKVKIVKDGQLLPQPFVNLPSLATGDRGLIGISFDPDYFSNHFVYFYYTGLDQLNRLVRFDATNDTATSDELILYQTVFPSEQLHVGGGIRFGPDGKLYFAVGDNGYHPNGQDLSNPHGKILRINKNGSTPTDNPFVNTTNALPEIWAYGLRNPWKFSFDPLTQLLYDGDVGEADTEEINKIVKGGNYGWPNCEGPCPQPNPNFIDPIYTYPHDGGSAAVTLGPVYRSSLFPTEYIGSLFFGDYAKGFIKRMKLDNNGNNAGVFDFDLNAGSVVDMRIAPDGEIYYLTYIPGALYKITYTTGNHIPIPNASASPTKGVEPLTVNFTSAGSHDSDGDNLFYLWEFGDGTTSTLANPQKTYPNKGKFIVKLTVSDGTNSAPANPIVIQVGLSPTVTIGSPQDGSTYRAGDTIFYSASGVDGAGFDISDSNFTTEIVFHHQTHIHPFLGPLTPNKNGSFIIPTTGESSPDTWYEIIVTATDTNGLSDTKSVRINPIKSNFTLETQPLGLQVLVDGIPTNTPTTITGIVGFKRELSVNPNQQLNNIQYAFDHWSDNGNIRHFITTPENPTTITAIFTPTSSFISEYFNNTELTGSPTFTRQDPTINFDFGSGSPDPRLNPEAFSIRWTKQQFFSSGKYKFTTRTDDGVRLYIDGVKVIDEWHGQGGDPHSAVLDLTSGNHEIKMEYFESGGGALAKLTWELTTEPVTGTTPPPPPPTTAGFNAQYFDNQNLIGITKLARTDPEINFIWNDSSPDHAIPVDQFSARWTKDVALAAGTYKFITTSDDGVRVFVDNQLIIDQWIDQSSTTYNAEIQLTEGNHNIKIEYYEAFGGALMKFNFEKISSTPPGGGTTPPVNGNYQAEYWNLSTTNYPPEIPTTQPTLTRTDTAIDFTWNEFSPDPAINADGFTVRWNKQQNFDTGTYRFTTSSDDGIRVFIDNVEIINDWSDHGLKTETTDKALTAGTHNIRVEYYEHGGGAVAKFSFNKISDTPPVEETPEDPAYKGEYFDNQTLSGSPILTKQDANINFVVNEGSPDPLVPNDHFSVRWTRNKHFAAGTYTFTTKSDDGIRLYIDGNLVIDNWNDHAMMINTSTLTLSAGLHNIKVEYYENAGGAVAILEY